MTGVQTCALPISSVPPKQHYSIFKSCWASGSQYPNTNGVAAENEGGPPGNVSEPLTPYQEGLNIRAISELSEFRNWEPRRPTSEQDKNATLYEHRECKRFGSDPTACPSSRIPWATILAGLEDDVSKQDVIDAMRDPNAFPELNGKSMVEHIQAMDNYILKTTGQALEKAAEILKTAP